MRLHKARLLAFLLCASCAPVVLPQEIGCNNVHLFARMARTQSPQVLTQLGALAGDSYSTRLVFNFRMFEIQADGDSALKVIELIPQDQDQDRVWHSLDGLLCGQESVAEMKSLGSLQARLPHDLAKAIDLDPAEMYRFVSYAYDSIQDPQSDYAVQMQSVCRHHHGTFLKAVGQMPEKDRNWFATKIFDPAVCRAIALPEAN
jgi:hypothetical protein